MGVGTGDTVVLVANNKDGSVNGMTFKVVGLIENLMGPGGRDGYLHIDDAAALLRMEAREVSEIAVRINDFDRIDVVTAALRNALGSMTNNQNKPMVELHTWWQLTPFYNVVRMINIMTLGIRAILIAVVLISVLNVMMMSVYERVREIGNLAAMGTPPGRILGLFVAEGFCWGFQRTAGAVIGLLILWILNLKGVSVAFGGAKQVFILAPSISLGELISPVSSSWRFDPGQPAAGRQGVPAGTGGRLTPYLNLPNGSFK